MEVKKKIKKEIMLPAHFEKAFKPADIRGIYPIEINEEVVYRTARAFATLYDLKEVLLGRDMRLSSASLHKAFVRGARDQGARVIDIGLVDTPSVYFASGAYDLYGAMITASHNPKEYNGLKLVKAGAIPLTDTDGLAAIQMLVVENKFSRPKQKGSIQKKSIINEYKKYLQSLVNIQSDRRIRMVVDAGNGMATVLAPIICGGFSVDISPLFFGLDGSFPNRGSDPTVEKNLAPIHDEIRRVRPDFGVAFDGDVDRAAFFDEKSRSINSAFIGALIAKRILQKPGMRGAKIVYTNFTSKIFFETIQKYGGIPVRAKVGHALIKNVMRQKDAVFACELSAHFYFKENFYTDSGILAFLCVLEEYARPENEGKKFSELVSEFDVYKQTEEVLITVRDKDAILAAVKKRYRELRPLSIDTFDGLHVAFRDYWFTLAKSVTEDALKLVLEAMDEKTMRKKQRETLALVHTLDEQRL